MSKIFIDLIFRNLKNSWNLLIFKSRDHQNRVSGPVLILIDISKLNLSSFFLNSWISICRNTMSKILINLIFCNLRNSWNLLITKSRDHQNRISGPALIFIDTPKLNLGKIFINFWISIWRNTMSKILVNFDFRNLENFWNLLIFRSPDDQNRVSRQDFIYIDGSNLNLGWFFINLLISIWRNTMNKIFDIRNWHFGLTMFWSFRLRPELSLCMRSSFR